MTREAKQPKYSAERCQILHRICKGFSRSLARGVSFHAAAIRIVRRWDGREYTSAPGKRLEISATTLRTAYASWKTNPRPEAFLLRYKCKAADYEKFSAKLCVACGWPGVVSVAAGIRILNSQMSQRSGYRILTAQQRDQVSTLHKARIQARQAERRFQRFAKEMEAGRA